MEVLGQKRSWCQGRDSTSILCQNPFLTPSPASLRSGPGFFSRQ